MIIKDQVEFLKRIVEYDLFICSAGFENRSCYIPENVKEKYSGKVVTFYIEDFYKINIENATKIKGIFEKNETIEIPLYYYQPEKSYWVISELLYNEIKISGLKKIIIDITSFTHEHLLMIYQILKEKYIDTITLAFCYVGAIDYSIDQSEYEMKWLTKGGNTSRSIIGYSGVISPIKKNHLIAIIGFETSRLRRILTNSNYDKVTVLYGNKVESFNEYTYNIGKKIVTKIAEEFRDVEKLEISIMNIESLKNQLTSFILQNKEYNNIILPMSNKISTIAFSQVALTIKEIQARYIPADEYNKDNYSICSDKIMYFEHD